MAKVDPNASFVLLQLDSRHLKHHGLLQILLGIGFILFRNPLVPLSVTISIGLIMLGAGLSNIAGHIQVLSRIRALSISNYFRVAADWIHQNRPDLHTFYLGRGFFWGTECTQMYNQLITMPALEQMVDLEPKGGGKIFLHNIGKEKEEHKFMRLPEHTIVAGTTGVGKTRTLSLLASQVIYSGEAIIIVDPKGDRDFLNSVYRLAAETGRLDDFQFLSLLHPTKSSTYDLFGDCIRADEVADRVQSVLTTIGGGAETTDPFIAFCWGLVHATAKLLLAVQKKVTPKSLYQSLVINPKGLLAIGESRLANSASAPERGVLREALDLYRAKVIDHPPEHAQKMTAVLIPTLTIMGTDETGELLSPDIAHIQIKDIIDNGRIVYISLGSMAVTRASATLGKLFVQNIVGHIGKEYGYSHRLNGVHVFVDEFYSLAYPGFIEMLGKVRAAGVHLYLGMQSSSDIASALGPVGVEQVITNTSNYICHRIPEAYFSEVISERFGQTAVPQKVVTRAISAGMDKTDNLFRSSTSERVQMVESPRITPEMLTSLPVGEAFVVSQGLMPLKLVLPLVDAKADIPDFFDIINPEQPFSLGLVGTEE